MKNHTLKLPLDLTKRHFVVGDIHGRYDAFIRLLESADYDPENDIVYSVGDIIDRGPKSVETLEFFNQKNTYAIRGNHEVMAISDEWLMVWLSNGGPATLNSLKLHNYTESWLAEQIQPLPYVIDVGENDEDHSFRIVHASLPLKWSEEEFQLIMDRAKDENDTLLAEILWSRTDIGQAVKNVDNQKPKMMGIVTTINRSGRNVFAGHTPINNVMKIGDTTYIDTWRSGTLSMVEAITMQSWTEKV